MNIVNIQIMFCLPSGLYQQSTGRCFLSLKAKSFDGQDFCFLLSKLFKPFFPHALYCLSRNAGELAMEWLIGTGIAVVAVGAYGFMSHNRLVALDERCMTAFADIDVLLKHRHSVIPGLVESVKAFVSHERELMLAVIQARADAIKAMTPELKLKAEKNVTQTVNALISACDRNPELKASDHFREFRADLKDVENRITASRRFYNLAVDEFNATLPQFPGSLTSRLARVTRRQHFDLGVERVLLDEPAMIKF